MRGDLIIILLLILLLICGAKEHFLINHKNKNCPNPWASHQPLLVNNKCKIRVSYLLYDAPDICCKNDITFDTSMTKSDCSDSEDCGECQEKDRLYKLRGNIYYPYKRFSTYCRPRTKNNWDL